MQRGLRELWSNGNVLDLDCDGSLSESINLSDFIKKHTQNGCLLLFVNYISINLIFFKKAK